MDFNQVRRELGKLELVDKLIFLRDARREYLIQYHLQSFVPDKAHYMGMYKALTEELRQYWGEADLQVRSKQTPERNAQEIGESKKVDNLTVEKKKPKRRKVPDDEMISVYINLSLKVYPERPTLHQLSQRISNVTNWHRKLKEFRFISSLLVEVKSKILSNYPLKDQTKEKLIHLENILKMELPSIAYESMDDKELEKYVKGNKHEKELDEEMFAEDISRGDQWGYKEQTDNLIDEIKV